MLLCIWSVWVVIWGILLFLGKVRCMWLSFKFVFIGMVLVLVFVGFVVLWKLSVMLCRFNVWWFVWFFVWFNRLSCLEMLVFWNFSWVFLVMMWKDVFWLLFLRFMWVFRMFCLLRIWRLRFLGSRGWNLVRFGRLICGSLSFSLVFLSGWLSCGFRLLMMRLSLLVWVFSGLLWFVVMLSFFRFMCRLSCLMFIFFDIFVLIEFWFEVLS